ncbi:MAG: hypothetical protein EHM28_05960 [Spirochaetaceae bacterium]|nr:MAG: hypothetical protein EHM28_05960 [Spirochaetaceae bacterium]
MKRITVPALIFMLAAGICFAQQSDIKIAFLDVENINRDTSYDYLAGMISGILTGDLSHTPGIILVDRNSMDAVLKEQALQVGDLSSKDELRVGKILGANYLVRAGFIYLGDDVMVNLTIINVETAKSTVISRRGRTENLIHAIAEETVKTLSTRTVTFQSTAGDRTLLSTKDVVPGSITVHSQLVRAQILLDDKFAGYTMGDRTVPFKIENVSPGKHSVKVVLEGFGVIKLPEVSFHDWEEIVDVAPGKNHVLQAFPQLFKYQLYELIRVLNEPVTMKTANSTWEKVNSISFQDRAGKQVSFTISAKAVLEATRLAITITAKDAGTSKTFTYKCPVRSLVKGEYPMGIVTIRIDPSMVREDAAIFTLYVERTDLTPDMWDQ